MRQRGAGGAAMVQDHGDRGRAAGAEGRHAALIHGDDVGHLGERLGVQRQVVAGGVHDDLVAALEDRELVGNDAHGPARGIGRRAIGPQGVDLGRREMFVALAEGTVGRSP